MHILYFLLKIFFLLLGLIVGLGISKILYLKVVKPVFNKLENKKRGAKNG